MKFLQDSGDRAHGPGLPGRALAFVLVVIPILATGQAMGDAAEGKRLATARDKGNCLACHAFDEGQLPGNIGPPLIYMKQRFPERAALRDQIWDASTRNPDTMMPPFGRHKILNDEEIDLIVDYLYTL